MKRSAKAQSDAQAPERRPLFTRTNLAVAALLLITGTGVALIVAYLLDDPSRAHYRDVKVVCIANPDELHSFTIESSKFIRHLRSRKPITCPECDSINLARAKPCVECSLHMPTGVHDLPPDNCPHCGAEQPSPTIGDHADLHAPGEHGEETAIIPLLDDPDPQ